MVETEEIKELIDTSDRLVASVSTDFHRYLSSEIDWSGRLICIKGASGTGKTTLMRQRLKEAFGVGGKGVYISLDDLWFSTHGVRDAIAYFEAHGYTHIFIDEVHHFGKDWSLLIKNVYDQFPNLSFVYTDTIPFTRNRADSTRSVSGRLSARYWSRTGRRSRTCRSRRSARRRRC